MVDIAMRAYCIAHSQANQRRQTFPEASGEPPRQAEFARQDNGWAMTA